MLISQKTNTNGVISAIIGNAEIASLGRAPGMSRTHKIAEMADARLWFLNFDKRFPGDILGDGSIAGYGAGFCIKWVFNNPKSYMNELVAEWKKADTQILSMIHKSKTDYLSYQKMKKSSTGRRKSLNNIRKPDKNTLNICSHALDVMRKCKEKYYG